MTAALFFLMLHAFVTGQEKYSLAYKMEKGNIYRYSQDNAIESTQEMGGQETKFVSDGHSIVRFQIDSVSQEGTMNLIFSNEEYKFHSRIMGRDTSMNINGLAGKRVQVQLSRLGKVLKETTIDSGMIDGKNVVLKFAGGAHFPQLPENQVSIGEKWPKNSIDTTIVGDGRTIVKSNVEYKLSGTESKGKHQCLRIEYKGTLETTGKMKQMGMDLVLEGTGEISGFLLFDFSAGLMVEEQSVTMTEVTMAVTGQAQMTIPMSQKITTTQKLLE